MATGNPNGKTEINITFGPNDDAAINGKKLEKGDKFNYTRLRITRREPITVDDPRLNSTIEYGWIRPSKLSTLSSFSIQIEYVRCARIEKMYIRTENTYSGRQEYYTMEVVRSEGFYYFIDTATRCGRTIGSSSDCNKNTESADTNLKNQIMNYKGGYPLTATANERETLNKQRKQRIEARSRNAIEHGLRIEKVKKEEQERIIKQRKSEQEEKLQKEIAAAKALLIQQGYTIIDPTNPQGGRRTRGRKTRLRKTRSRV